MTNIWKLLDVLRKTWLTFVDTLVFYTVWSTTCAQLFDGHCAFSRKNRWNYSSFLPFFALQYKIDLYQSDCLIQSENFLYRTTKCVGIYRRKYFQFSQRITLRGQLASNSFQILLSFLMVIFLIYIIIYFTLLKNVSTFSFILDANILTRINAHKTLFCIADIVTGHGFLFWWTGCSGFVRKMPNRNSKNSLKSFEI